MSVMTTAKLKLAIKSVAKSGEKFANDVQEALVSCAFYVMKDGNTTPLNDLLDAVGTGTRIRGLTVWAELFCPVRIKDDRFVLNKGAAKEYAVTDEASFAEYEETMRAAPRWDKIIGKEKAESIFDEGKYMERVIKKLIEEGEAELAEVLKNAEMAYRIKKSSVMAAV